MAADQEIGKLVIKLAADLSDLKRQFEAAKGTLKDFDGQVKTHTDAIKGTFASIKDSVGGALSGMQTAINFIAANALVQLAQSLRATASEIFAFMQMGARVIQIRDSFESITKASGIMGQRLIADMKAASHDTIKETDLMVKAQRLIVEGFSPKEITAMTHAAQIAARQMAIDVSEAFDLVTEAVLTGRTRGLRRAFPMEPEEVYRAYARNLGITVEALQENEKHWAILGRVIEMDAAYVKKYGEPIESISVHLQQQKKLWDELKEDIAVNVTPAAQNLLGYVWMISKEFMKWAVLKPPWVNAVEKLVTISGIVPSPPPEKPLSEHWTPEMEAAAQKEADEKAGKERIKRNEAIGKAVILVQKDVAKAEEELVKTSLEAERNIAVAEAVKRGQDTWVVEKDFAVKAAKTRYDAAIKSLKDEKAAKEEALRKDTMTAEGAPLPKEIQAKVNEEYYAKRKNAEAQLATETTKIQLEQIRMVTEAYMKAVTAERGVTPEMEPFALTGKQIAEVDKQSRLYWVERDKADADFEKQLATITGDFDLMTNAQVKSLEIERQQYMESDAWAKLSLDKQKEYNDLMDLRKIKLQELRELEKAQNLADLKKQIADISGNWGQVKEAEIEALDAQLKLTLASKEWTPEVREALTTLNELKKAELEAQASFNVPALMGLGVLKGQKAAATDLANQFENIIPNSLDVLSSSLMNAGKGFKNFFTSAEQGFLKMIQDIILTIAKMEILDAVKNAGGLSGLWNSIFGDGTPASPGAPGTAGGTEGGIVSSTDFASGGTFLATRPTTIRVGEGNRPEIGMIMPISKMVSPSVFGPSGGFKRLSSMQGFSGGGLIVSNPAGGGGEKDHRVRLDVSLDPSLILKSRPTAEETDLTVALKYKAGGHLYKAIKERG